MDPEIRRQLDQEAQEKFVRDQKKRQEEIDRQHALDSLKNIADYEAQIRSDEQREKLQREKEKLLWELKEKIVLTRELSEYICRRVASGEMLKAICDEQTMPTFQLVQEWFDDAKYDWFHKAYLRACKLRDRAFEDDIVMISDNSTNDYIEKVNSKTGETFRVLDTEALTRSKMRIETRLRIMKANNPARWGDNPNAGEATRELLRNLRPVVQISFVEAPKTFVKGDDAKVIEHKVEERELPPPYVELDKDDLEYIRRRNEAAKTKVKVA